MVEITRAAFEMHKHIAGPMIDMATWPTYNKGSVNHMRDKLIADPSMITPCTWEDGAGKHEPMEKAARKSPT